MECRMRQVYDFTRGESSSDLDTAASSTKEYTPEWYNVLQTNGHNVHSRRGFRRVDGCRRGWIAREPSARRADARSVPYGR